MRVARPGERWGGAVLRHAFAPGTRRGGAVLRRPGARRGGAVLRRAFAPSALAAALLLAGCGSDADRSAAAKPSASPVPTRTAEPAAEATPAALPAPSRHCGTPHAKARTLRFKTRDGVTLAGAIVGSGPVGAVLIHEYPGPMCGWWPYSVYLARHGVRALIFDLRCFGLSACPNGRGHAVRDVAAAMAALRRDGARSVALIGASMGGAIAVAAAARLHPAALVNLSGERNTSTLTPGIAINAGAAAVRVTAPALFVVARGDRYTPVKDMRAVAQRARSQTKRLIVLPASAGHGTDMLMGNRRPWTPLAREVAAFVRRHRG